MSNGKSSAKPYIKACIAVFILFLCVHYWSKAENLISTLASAAAPLLLGAVLAYILNILSSFFERHYFPKKHSSAINKSRRPVCMVFALLALIAIVLLIIRIVIPELVSCVKLLAEQVPIVAEKIVSSRLFKEIVPADILGTLSSIDWREKLSQYAQVLISGIGGTVGAVANVVSTVVSSVVTWVIAFIFSLYLLGGKGKILAQIKRLANSYIPKKANDKITYVLSVFNDSFHSYIVGQCIEAVILGTLCALGMLILRIPYAATVGVLVGFTALIPVAGAYIGAGLGAFMILSVSPMKALIFLIFIVVLQQIEGNVIYPRVVGTSVGLPGVWVLAAVTIGGSIAGVGGMLVGVPTAAALYRLLRADVNRREAELAVTAEK